MINYVQENIFQSNAEAITNPVKGYGDAKRGLAAQFKKKYPDNFAAFKSACKRGEIILGKVIVFETKDIKSPNYIINFPVQLHWRDEFKLEHVELGLNSLVYEAERLKIKSIAIPPLSRCVGGLIWEDVKACIETAFAQLPNTEFFVYEPSQKKIVIIKCDICGKENRIKPSKLSPEVLELVKNNNGCYCANCNPRNKKGLAHWIVFGEPFLIIPKFISFEELKEHNESVARAKDILRRGMEQVQNGGLPQ